MTRLLVSVRDVDEAEAALAGGADLIDVKEPARGSLGKADDAVIRAVVARVAGRVPVSAALGEWHEASGPNDLPLDFVKWGPAGGRRSLAAWRSFMRAQVERRESPQCVFVAYADADCAQAPPLLEVVELACAAPGRVLLIDTHCKDGAAMNLPRRPTLLDWLSEESIAAICQRCRRAGTRIALAGSLGLEEIEQLQAAAPDWFAVRGAACSNADRGACLDLEKVRTLARLVREVCAAP